MAQKPSVTIKTILDASKNDVEKHLSKIQKIMDTSDPIKIPFELDTKKTESNMKGTEKSLKSFGDQLQKVAGSYESWKKTAKVLTEIPKNFNELPKTLAEIPKSLAEIPDTVKESIGGIARPKIAGFRFFRMLARVS